MVRRLRQTPAQFDHSSVSFVNESSTAQSSTILPSRGRKILMPMNSARFPVGAMPLKSPRCVPLQVQRATTLSPSTNTSSFVKCTSGKAARIAEIDFRMSSTPRTSRPPSERSDNVPGGRYCLPLTRSIDILSISPHGTGGSLDRRDRSAYAFGLRKATRANEPPCGIHAGVDPGCVSVQFNRPNSP
jgi:hypothetical protein